MLQYLDTARLGQMCPAAQQADRDFVRLAGEEGCSPYFEHFLRGGYSGLPPSLRRRCPGLSDWAGVGWLQNAVKTFLGISRDREVLLANRSAELVRLAARLLSAQCRSILITDMLWPAYREILQAECRRTGCMLTSVAVRDAVLHDTISAAELVDRLVGHYRRQNCDGLLLSAVTFQGVRLPVQQVCQAVGSTGQPGFVVVDAAQALNHTPLSLHAEYCDLVLAGCHKWLRAYHPLGLALCCRASSEPLVTAACREMLDRRELDDPLLRFTGQLQSGATESFSETVNLAPMFTATAAVGQMMRSDRSKRDEFSCQVENGNRLAARASDTGWRPVQPHKDLRSGILLLQATRDPTRRAPPDSLRTAFRLAGVSLTAYPKGLVRTSLPQRTMTGDQLDHVRSALCRCA